MMDETISVVEAENSHEMERKTDPRDAIHIVQALERVVELKSEKAMKV